MGYGERGKRKIHVSPAFPPLFPRAGVSGGNGGNLYRVSPVPSPVPPAVLTLAFQTEKSDDWSVCTTRIGRSDTLRSERLRSLGRGVCLKINWPQEGR